MSFFPAPKSGAGGLPGFPGLAGGGGMPDFSAFAAPREKATVALPEFASIVPKAKPVAGLAGGVVKKPTTNDNVATFTATHKQWHGQVELFRNQKFNRVGKDGGLWRIEWDAQRENDDGDRSGDLCLTWTKWGTEHLRTTDGGRTFKCAEYIFELELMSSIVPQWIGTEMSESDMPDMPEDMSTSAPDNFSRNDDPRSGNQATSRGATTDTTWRRGDTVPEDPDAKGPTGPTSAPTSQPAAESDSPRQAVRPSGGRSRLQFKMPTRAERATGLTRKYKEIGSILMNEEEMSKVEPTAVMSFLKKTIGDIHQLSTLTMKYKKENEDGTSETKETTAAEVLGLTQAGMAALQKCRLLNFLENDDEKRTSVLKPICQRAFAIVEPYLTWTLEGDGKDKIPPTERVALLCARVSEHGYTKGVPQRANFARGFPDPAVRDVEMAEHDRKWQIEAGGVSTDCGDEIYFLKKKDKYATEYEELEKLAGSAQYASDNHVQKLLKDVKKKRTK